MTTAYKIMLLVLFCAFGCEALDGVGGKTKQRLAALSGLAVTGALFIAACAIL